MTTTPVIRIAALAALALALAAPVTQAASEPQVHTSGGIEYMSGGVSEEGRDALASLAQGYNLKLVLATKSGAYLSDVGIVISDNAGRPLVETRSEGPWFFAKLPAGSYTIAATSGGTTVRRPVKIGARAMDRVDLRWDD